MARTTIKTDDIKDLNVTSGKIETNLTISGNLVISGNLTVSGTTTTVNTQQLLIEDNLITLNSGYTADPNGATPPPDSGIEIERGIGDNAYIIWDETNDRWNLSHPIYYLANGNSVSLNIEQMNNDIDIWKIAQSDTHKMGFYLRYKGSESGDNKALELWTDNQTATAQRAYRIQQSGAMLFDQTATFNNNIVMATGKTIDGVDISAHDSNSIVDHKHVTDAMLAALAGTSGTAPSGTNKFVDNTDSRLTNSRTPNTHGDSLHSALAYFDKVSDGTTTLSATTANQNIKFTAGGAASVSVGALTGYDANITISATNNYVSATTFDKNTEIVTYARAGLANITTDLSSTWLKLTNGTEQTIASDVKISGNLTVSGTMTTVDTVNLVVSDNIIVLNNDVTTTPTENAGIEIERGTSANVSILWNESSDRWTLTEDGTNYYRIVTQTFDGDLTLNGNLKIGGNDAGPNYISFRGTTGDLGGTYTYIGERIYSGTENSELFLFKGNDIESSGSDRIRLGANNIMFDTYATVTSGAFDTVATSANLTTKMIIKENGRVGIGTISPSTLLDVNGTIKSTGFQLGSSTTAGYVLTANTSGIGTWSALPADKYLSAVSSTDGGNGTITFTVANGTNITLNATHTHSYLPISSSETIDVNAMPGYSKLYLGSSANWTNKYTSTNNATGFVNLNTHPGSYYSQLWFDTGGDNFYHRVINNGVIGNWRKVWTDGNLTFGTSATNMATGNHTHANLSAGNGITGTTYNGSTAYDWSIVSHAGTAGSIGTIVVGTDTIGVSLGTTSTTAAAGNHTHTINDVTWLGNQNLICSATANGQEWSIDLSPGTYTNTYWQVYSVPRATACLKADSNTGNVSTGFNLTVGGTLAVTGISATVGGQAVVLTNDTRLTDARTAVVHGDEKHNHQVFARILFAKGQSKAVWTHNKNWSDYIVQITPDSPETHFFYSEKTNNSISICLDDEAYEALNVDVMLTNASSIAASGFTMS